MKDGDTADSRTLFSPDGMTDFMRAAFWEKECRKQMRSDEEMRTYFAKQFIKTEGVCPATWPHIISAFERLLEKG